MARRAALLAIFVAAGCTSASDFGTFHAGPGGDTQDLSIQNLDDLGLDDLRTSPTDGKPMPGDFARSPDLQCGVPGGPCCNGTTCLNSCCSNGLCAAIGSSCSGPQTICVDGQPPKCADCGHAGQICCAQSACSMGGCCNMGSCVASGDPVTTDTVCENNAIVACGDKDQACCGYNYCRNGGCCYGQTCIRAGDDCNNISQCNGLTGGCGSCGSLGFACCPGSPNGGNNADFCTGPGGNLPEIACDVLSDQCATCGGLGQPCCDGNRCDGSGCCDHGRLNNVENTLGSCVSVGSDCTNGKACTAGGDCSGCGGIGQVVCPGQTGCTAAFSLNVNNSCVRCGGLGEPCCTGHAGGYCSEPFGCDGKNTCHPCGGQGQVCCPGEVCRNGKGCQNAMCN